MIKPGKLIKIKRNHFSESLRFGSPNSRYDGWWEFPKDKEIIGLVLKVHTVSSYRKIWEEYEVMHKNTMLYITPVNQVSYFAHPDGLIALAEWHPISHVIPYDIELVS